MSIRAMRDRAYAKRVRAELAANAAEPSNAPVDAFDLFATSEVKVRPKELEEPQYVTRDGWFITFKGLMSLGELRETYSMSFDTIWIDEAKDIDWPVLEKRIWFGVDWARRLDRMVEWAYPSDQWSWSEAQAPKLLDRAEPEDKALRLATPWAGKVIDFEVEIGLATRAPEWVGRQKNWSRNK